MSNRILSLKDSYLRAKKSGEKAARKAVSEGRWPYLESLSRILPSYEVLSKIPVGVMDIPLNQIAGTLTEGRENAFACNFMPLLSEGSEFAAKWANLLEAQETEGIHDAILVYEYMNRFYVQEGNKRVSVLKYEGALSITADVRRVMPVLTEEKEVQVYYEFLDFFRVTGLYDIVMTEKGSYAQLAGIFGCDLAEAWPEKKVKDLKAGFYYFQKVYEAKGGRHLRITAGEAFLLYLRIFRGSRPERESQTDLEKNIEKLWNELLSATDSEAVLIEDEEQAGKPAGLLQKLTSVSVLSSEKPLRVAFLYSRDADHSRWTYAHELGRNELEEKYQDRIETVHLDNCDTEEALDRAFDTAAADEDMVVFTTTPAMMDASMRAAIRYPRMKVLNCSIHLSSSAVRTYYPRMHEAKFLMGALAAIYASDHRIGYLADYPIYGSVARINAFALGAASVDPHAQIILKWMGKKDCDWKAELEGEKLQVISGPDMILPDEVSRQGYREYGVYRKTDGGQTERLAAPIWYWGKYYDRIIRTILDGGWNSIEQTKREKTISYWYGLRSGVIDVIQSGSIPYYSRKMLSWMREGIISGGLQPFAGELHSQQGVIQGEDAPSLSGEQIILMNWLNDNVIGEIPSLDELPENIRAIADRGIVKEGS